MRTILGAMVAVALLALPASVLAGPCHWLITRLPSM